MQKYIRLVGAVALIGLGVWLWSVLFPSPEKAIRSLLHTLARNVSFSMQESVISRGFKVEKAAGFFTASAEISLDLRGVERFEFASREEISQALMAVANNTSAVKVEFLDINVSLDPDGQTAKANLTGKWTVPGDRDLNAQEFNFFLRKESGTWLIYRIETVKTLSQIAPHAA